MRKNQILPVLGAGGDGAAVGQQHPQGASQRASPNPRQCLSASTHTTRQVPPRSHLVCPLLPCPGSDRHKPSPAPGQRIPAQPASRHNQLSCQHLQVRLPGAFLLDRSWQRDHPLRSNPFPGSTTPVPRIPINEAGNPGFQTGFSMTGKLQALGCPPFREEVVSEHRCGDTAEEA